MFEEHVRFMILCEHELSSLSMDVYNSHLNLEQINKVGRLGRQEEGIRRVPEALHKTYTQRLMLEPQSEIAEY